MDCIEKKIMDLYVEVNKCVCGNSQIIKLLSKSNQGLYINMGNLPTGIVGVEGCTCKQGVICCSSCVAVFHYDNAHIKNDRCSE